jgi:N-acetylmuramoyl-L-alanine amidase
MVKCGMNTASDKMYKLLFNKKGGYMGTSFSRSVLFAVLLAFFWGHALRAAAGEETASVLKDKVVFYTVQEGDSLSEIAEEMGVPLPVLIRANRLSSTVIHPRQVLIVPGRNLDYDIAISRGFTREEINLLARAIYAEARGESFTGQVAVGAVILNRIESREFPKTLREVIMQKQSGTYQFSPVEDGSINLQPDETALCAALQAIAGYDPTNGALYFYNPETAGDRWIRNLPVIARIGNHVFATKI